MGWVKGRLRYAGVPVSAANDLNQLLASPAIIPELEYNPTRSGVPSILVRNFRRAPLKELKQRISLAELRGNGSMYGVIWGDYILTNWKQ